jgi:SAM-dependent methyltransferase
MSRVQSIADPQYVHNQYRDASHLNARIRLHQEFSTNPYGWQRWLFDQLKFTSRCRVLELGCGAGNLWSENLARLPVGAQVVLSDLSAGMAAQSRCNLERHPAFQFAVIDAQSIPFEAGSFDMVIAAHMLYHVPERDKALSEIQRVLKPGRRFYASTIGEKHLQELGDLVARFDPDLSEWGIFSTHSFNLENGAAQLEAVFFSVSLVRYEDALEVTDAGALVDFILSRRIELSAEQQLALSAFVEQELKAHQGKFYITKDSGVFEASGIVPS